MAQANLITKKDFDSRLQNINQRITSNETKHILVENELRKVENFDVAYYRGKNFFEGDDTQNYLVFQPVYKYFKIESNKISL